MVPVPILILVIVVPTPLALSNFEALCTDGVMRARLHKIPLVSNPDPPSFAYVKHILRHIIGPTHNIIVYMDILLPISKARQSLACIAW